MNGEFYHIYNRGNGRQQIFFNDEDYHRFIKLLFICNSTKQVNFRDDIIEKKINAWDFDRGETIVSIGAWVLMPYRIHISWGGSFQPPFRDLLFLFLGPPEQRRQPQQRQ